MIPVTLVAAALTVTPSVQLSALAKLYLDYDLPLPPKDAKLYRFTRTAFYTKDDDKAPPPTVWIAFGYAPNKEDRPTKTMLDLKISENANYSYSTATEIKPDSKALDGISTDYRARRDYGPPDIPFAVQCELRGCHELAMATLTAYHADKERRWPARESLAFAAWGYWNEQLRTPNTDRARIARRFQLILPDLPEDFRKHYQKDLNRLKLSMVPSKAKPGTAEACIDELVDVAIHPWWRSSDDLRIEAVARLGFDAIPVLLDHLSDERLTRSYYDPLTGGLQFTYEVRHFARDILNEFIATEEEPRRGESEIGKKEINAMRAWWAEAKQIGEEKFLFSHLYPERKGPNDANRWDDKPNEFILLAIEAKYPERLPNLIAEIRKERPNGTDIRPLYRALERSKLPTATKRKVLLGTLDGKGGAVRGAALKALRSVDVDEFHKRLIAALDDTDPGSEWLEQGYVLVEMVANTTNAKAWAVAGKYFRRVDSEMKISWINELARFSEHEETRGLRIDFLLAVMSDAKLKDIVHTGFYYEGSDGKGYELRTTNVQNVAAFELNRLVGVKANPHKDWTPAEWEKFRDEVAKAAKETLKEKK